MQQAGSVQNNRQRKIIHIDMDAFFAAVEQRDRPELQGRPVIVGGSPHSRGVVATCSYQARKFGIHSAMSCARAYQLCPQAVFVRPRMQVYRQVSAVIHQVFQQYTELVEPLSLDEAYLDVSHSSLGRGSASLMAEEIRRQIFAATGLTASAGVSYNKFLAKIASDINKPDGQCVIRPEDGESFVQQLPVARIHGVGKVTEAKMHALGIHTGADLSQWTLPQLAKEFGKSAHYYYAIARGDDDRPVASQRTRKSLGTETTFQNDLTEVGEMQQHLLQLASKVYAHLRQKNLLAYTLTIKVKYHDFRQVTRSITLQEPITNMQQMSSWIPRLLEKTEVDNSAVRLLGVSVSSFNGNAPGAYKTQLDMFEQ